MSLVAIAFSYAGIISVMCRLKTAADAIQAAEWENEIPPAIKVELEFMFAILDRDKTGKISMEEWKAAGLPEEQFFKYAPALFFEACTCSRLTCCRVDKDKSNTILRTSSRPRRNSKSKRKSKQSSVKQIKANRFY